MSFLRRFVSSDDLCFSCRNTVILNRRWIDLGGYRVYGLHVYDGVIRHLLLRYKENYDRLLAGIFLNGFKLRADLFYDQYVLVCVPSNTGSTLLRGFNTVHEMALSLNMPIIEGVLVNRSVSKQGLKSLEARLSVGHDLSISDETLIRGKKIILLDDILTTGSTMKACLDLLSPHCDKIVGLCVAYHKSYIETVVSGS